MLHIQSSQMSDVVMPVDFLEGAILVSEVAPDAVRAEFLPIELPAILRFVLVVHTLLLLLKVEWVVLTELLRAMSVLALNAVAAEAHLGPVLAELTFVHGALDEGLCIVAPVLEDVLRLDWLDRREGHLGRLDLRHKSSRLNIHAREWIEIGRRGLLWRGLRERGNEFRHTCRVSRKCRSTSVSHTCVACYLQLVGLRKSAWHKRHRHCSMLEAGCVEA